MYVSCGAVLVYVWGTGVAIYLVYFIACVVLHLHFQGFLGGEKSRRFPVRAELEKDSWKNGKRQQFHCLTREVTFSCFLLHLCGRARYCRFTFTFSPLPCQTALENCYPLIGFKLVARIRPNTTIGQLVKHNIKSISNSIWKQTDSTIGFSTIKLVILHIYKLFG